MLFVSEIVIYYESKYYEIIFWVKVRRLAKSMEGRKSTSQNLRKLPSFQNFNFCHNCRAGQTYKSFVEFWKNNRNEKRLQVFDVHLNLNSK